MIRPLLALATLGTLGALVAPAAAQSASAQAEALYNRGREQMAAGKTAEACASFESSEKAAPGVATLFAVGVCREKNGQLATAWGAFVEVQRMARASTGAEDQQYAQLATANAARLEPKLSKLTIAVPAGVAIAGLEVHRDGDVVDAGAWNQPLPIDGGSYKITARAPGHEDWSTTVSVKNDSDAQTVTLPPLAAAAVASSSSGAPEAPRSYKLPILFGAVAVVLGAAAITFEVVAEHDNNLAQSDGATSHGLDQWHSANSRRYTAEGLGIAGVASAGAAIFLLVRHPHESETQQTARRLELVPLASPQVAGLQLDGRW